MSAKEKVSKIAPPVIFAVWLIFNGILLARHELWRDEANVWLMARELTPWELLGEIKYQGHPCLWYLLVMPFAKAGLPFKTIGILSLSVMSFAAVVFLKKAPISLPIKGICLFSPIFTYFYSDIARNYCLIAILLILLAWCYPQRNSKSLLYGLLLGLLVQADTIALAPAGMISLVWVCEAVWKSAHDKRWEPVKRMLKGAWIPLLSLLFWFLQFYQVSESPEYSVRELGLGELVQETKNFAFAIIIRMTGWEKKVCLLFLLTLFAVMLLICVRIRNWQTILILTVSYLFQAFFSAVIYQLHIWHYISLCFVLIYSIWVLGLQGKESHSDDKILRGAMWGLEILLGLLAVCMFLNWNSDRESSNLENAWNGLYSDGVHVAEYMEENIPKEALIISDDIPMASTVLAYLKDYQFYYAGNGEVASYADWSREQSGSVSFAELVSWVSVNFPENECFYLLKTSQSCVHDSEALADCTVLYRTKEETARGEEYTLYQIDVKAVNGEEK